MDPILITVLLIWWVIVEYRLWLTNDRISMLTSDLQKTAKRFRSLSDTRNQ